MNPENKKTERRSWTIVFVSLAVCFVCPVAFFAAVWIFIDLPVGDIQNTDQSDQNIQKSLKIGEQVIEIDIADTATERNLGLSGRKSLGENQGLLFIFETPALYGFWMKDMLFSIDIMWIDEQKKIVHIESDVSPETYPKSFTPSVPAKYVLEVRTGFAKEKGIKVGDGVVF